MGLKDQIPLMASGLPVESCNSPSNFPVARSYAAINPLDSVVPPAGKLPDQQIVTEAAKIQRGIEPSESDSAILTIKCGNLLMQPSSLFV